MSAKIIDGKALAARWRDLVEGPRLRAILGDGAEPEDTRRAWPIPTRYARGTLADGRVLFAGDAAAVVDPMTGEGIAQAIETGTLAVDAIAAGGTAASGAQERCPALRTGLKGANRRRREHQTAGRGKLAPEERETHGAEGRRLKQEVADVEARLEGEVQERAWGRLALLSDPFGNGLCLLQFLKGGYAELLEVRVPAEVLELALDHSPFPLEALLVGDRMPWSAIWSNMIQRRRSPSGETTIRRGITTARNGSVMYTVSPLPSRNQNGTKGLRPVCARSCSCVTFPAVSRPGAFEPPPILAAFLRR